MDPVAVAVNVAQLPLLFDTFKRVGKGFATVKFRVMVVSKQPFWMVIV